MSSGLNERPRAAIPWKAPWRPALAALLIAYVVLAVGYSLANPIYESTDELRHFRYVRHILVYRSLPVQRIDAPRAQSHHPPLYYALGALVSGWVPVAQEVYYEPPENPFWGYRYWEVGDDNKNQYVHGDDGPFRGIILAVYAVRWMTVLIGAGVVWLTYLVGCEVFGVHGSSGSTDAQSTDRRHPAGILSATSTWSRRALALGGAALVAFNPQFLYLSGAVNNDIPAALCSVAVLWMCVRLVRTAVADRSSTVRSRREHRRLPRGLGWRNDVALGVLYGLALLTKFNLLALLAPIGLAYLLAVWSTRDWRALLRGLVVVLGLAALISGWWFLRNWRLYGDPTGLKQLNKLWAGRPAAGHWWVIEQSLPYLWSSLWGRFGYGQVPLPQFVYQGLFGLCLVSLIGYLFPRRLASSASGPTNGPTGGRMINVRGRMINVRGRTINVHGRTINVRLSLLMGAFALTFAAVVLYYMMIQPAGAMGRFFFPGLPALAIILVHGLRRILCYIGSKLPNAVECRRMTQAVGLIVVVGMIGLAIYALAGVLAPAFARPRPLTASEMESLPNPTRVEFGGLARLLGYRISPTTVEPGGVVEVTLYWQALDRTERDYAVFVHLLSDMGTMIAQRDTYPGLGRYPTTAWEPGVAFADTYRIHIPETAYAPDAGYVQVGIYLPDGPRLTTPDGRDAARLETIEVRPREGRFPNPLAVNFGHRMMLVGYTLDRRVVQPGDTIHLTLYWRAMAPMEVDYRIFAHVLGVQDQVWANSDSEPVGGASLTSRWQPGEVVEDNRELTVGLTTPPDFYDVEVGVYAFSVGRLPVVAEDGHLLDDRVFLSRIRVVDGE